MKHFLQSGLLLVWFAVLLGLIYPLVFTFFAKMTWGESAEGSLLIKEGKPRGSVLVAQSFTSDRYFWPRPSFANYATLPSEGPEGNLSSQKMSGRIALAKTKLMDKHGVKDGGKVPAGLLFDSASGLDPDLMVPSALFQVERVAKARGLDTEAGREKVIELVMQAKVKKPLNLFGRECVNVLLLNESLDALEPRSNP